MRFCRLGVHRRDEEVKDYRPLALLVRGAEGAEKSFFLLVAERPTRRRVLSRFVATGLYVFQGFLSVQADFTGQVTIAGRSAAKEKVLILCVLSVSIEAGGEFKGNV